MVVFLFLCLPLKAKNEESSTGAFVVTFILVNYGKTGGNPITMAEYCNFYILKSVHIKELAFEELTKLDLTSWEIKLT